MLRSLALSNLAIATLAAASAIDERSFIPENIIEKDVAIIGGGASGTYAAVRLREDYNKSIILIEKDDRLGGHVNTYHDPVTNTLIDYGVETYLRYGNSVAFFERFNISITAYDPPSLNEIYVSAADGSLLSNYSAPSSTAEIAGFETWLNLTAEYKDLLDPGFLNFPNGSAIPELLLTPFGKVTEMYPELKASVPLMVDFSNVAVGGIDKVLTMYVMIAVGYPITSEFLAADLFVPANASNSLLYEKALALLRKDVLLESYPIAGERNSSGVKLLIHDGESNNTKLVKAKTLLWTPPPALPWLKPLQLDAHEKQVLSLWTYTWLDVGVIRIPGIPTTDWVWYYSPAAEGSNWEDIRDWPWALYVQSTAQNDSTFEILFSTNYTISDAEAKKTVTENIAKLFEPSGPYSNATDTSIEWLAFNSHYSVLWRQSPEVMRSGFVQQLYGLQGRKSTWYTGGLWAADYTGTSWAFTDTVLPKLVASL